MGIGSSEGLGCLGALNGYSRKYAVANTCSFLAFASRKERACQIEVFISSR